MDAHRIFCSLNLELHCKNAKNAREWKLERCNDDDDDYDCSCSHHTELTFLCVDRDIKSVTFYFYSHYLLPFIKTSDL